MLKYTLVDRHYNFMGERRFFFKMVAHVLLRGITIKMLEADDYFVVRKI